MKLPAGEELAELLESLQRIRSVRSAWTDDDALRAARRREYSRERRRMIETIVPDSKYL